MIQELLRSIGNLFTWFVIVAPWEQAIRIRFGKDVKLLGAGAYLKIPFCDRLYRSSIRRRISTIRPQALTMRDGKTVSIASCFAYEITDMRKLFDTLDHAEGTIESEVAGRVAQYVAMQTVDAIKPLEMQKEIQASLDFKKYGLSGEEFFITSFAVVKTYRLITGDLPWWNHHSTLDTTTAEGRT